MTDLNLYTIIPYHGQLLKFSDALSARAYYKNHYIDLLTGENHSFEIEGWLSDLNFKVYDHALEKRFIHLFYELGFLFENLSEEIKSSELLAIDIQYSQMHRESIVSNSKKINLSLVEAPRFRDYKKQFDRGYRELTAGNCYQFNLSYEYVYSFEADDLGPVDFINTLWAEEKNRGAYASATYIESIGKLFLSNSPECLFQYSGDELITRPIKGTMKRKSEECADANSLWKEISQDKKSQSELYMITDLLRNDLSRIDLPRAQVKKKKAKLLVPGLIHQYSEISVQLREHITLKNILEKIFPGGSITGAPKKRVMQILRGLEARTRGFYCGSTLLFAPGQVEASINIRSSVVDFNSGTLSYQAGGGVTLLSSAQVEFEEMTYKHDSYIDLLTL